MAISGIVTEIERYSIHDGPGIRTVVFLKGCLLRCKWCCNPETFKPRIEMGFFADKCLENCRCIHDCPYGAIILDPTLGMTTNWAICQQKCFGVTEEFPCTKHCYSQARRNIGIRMSIADVLEEVEKDRQLYDRSGGGVTLTGGEISMQPEFSSALLRVFKQRWIDTAIETNGSGKAQFYRAVADDLDFVFLDIKSISDKKHTGWTGYSNLRILENAKLLSGLSQERGFTFVVRTPVIPGFNDTEQEIGEIARFVGEHLPGVDSMELLPYHNLGKDKYQSIGLQYELNGLNPPNKEKILELENVVQSFNVQTVNY